MEFLTAATFASSMKEIEQMAFWGIGSLHY
jgi:hypothetical protein